jgi:orotate phosphoribosyltransferase-like protein
VPEIQRLRDEGMTVPQICAELDVTYHVVNQVITQSYKMAMDTVGVFERQERMRLGLEEV